MGFAKVRLYVDQPLGPGQPVALTQDQAHYLFTVMRLARGAAVLVFNGRDGEWRADVAEAGRRGGVLVAAEQTLPLRLPPDLWLVFAPLKKARTDFIVEKATELGAARILPVQTRFTNADRIQQDRLQAHAIEAAEQCGGTYVPDVADLQSLDRLLDDWPADRWLMWCDEHLAGDGRFVPSRPVLLADSPPPPSPPHGGEGRHETPDVRDVRPAWPHGGSEPIVHLPSPPWGGDGGGGPQDGKPTLGPWAILTGPEGGFAEAEQARIRAMSQAVPVSLGPRILRADTAAVAALALWQATLGDWR